VRTSQPDLARDVAIQIFDNALIQAGLIDDGRAMVPRINKLLEIALGGSQTGGKEIPLSEKVEKVDEHKDPFTAPKSSGFKEL